MTRIAVWGANGFAGARLTRAAEEQGWTVRRLGRAELDFNASEQKMAAALSGIEIAFHCAGKVAEPDAAGYAAAAARFARACAAARVRRLVYLGTVAVYGPRHSGFVGTDTPLLGSGAYAESRIEAELAIQAALSGTRTAWSIVRVPMLVGRGMPGTVLERFFRVLRLGLFPHPGPEEATLPCLGMDRLAAILLRLPDQGNATWQFADNLRWTEIAQRRGRVIRIRLPSLPGRFAVFSSTARYADDAGAGLPSTWRDIDELLKP